MRQTTIVYLSLPRLPIPFLLTIIPTAPFLPRFLLVFILSIATREIRSVSLWDILWYAYDRRDDRIMLAQLLVQLTAHGR